MKNQETGEFVCDFCGKHQDKVAKMFTSHSMWQRFAMTAWLCVLT